jgi:hypothetical protein
MGTSESVNCRLIKEMSENFRQTLTVSLLFVRAFIVLGCTWSHNCGYDNNEFIERCGKLLIV